MIKYITHGYLTRTLLFIRVYPWLCFVVEERTLLFTTPGLLLNVLLPKGKGLTTAFVVPKAQRLGAEEILWVEPEAAEAEIPWILAG